VEEQRRIEEKRRRRKKLLLAIIIILILTIILYALRIVVIEDVSYAEEVPVEKQYQTNGTRVLKQETCTYNNYNWNYSWEGWEPEFQEFIAPKYRLRNLEDREGTFYVRFGFFDNGLHPFVRYQGKDYETIRDELPWSFASMLTENLSYVVGPKKDILITPVTKKANSKSTYWVYADINLPKYRNCTGVYESEKISPNRTYIIYETKTSLEQRNTTVRLIDYIIYLLKK
jgi:hypothetical protein